MPNPKSAIDRKVYGMRVEKALYQEIQHLAIDLEKNANDLLEEGMRLVLQKYKKKGK
ncbi:MAG: hypothetical protein R3B95_19295 [Nitrospirales bacterium]|nr:hypothetical protein [Nitrospirales bacterium]